MCKDFGFIKHTFEICIKTFGAGSLFNKEYWGSCYENDVLYNLIPEISQKTLKKRKEIENTYKINIKKK